MVSLQGFSRSDTVLGASFTAAAAVSGSASANAAVGALGAPAARFAGVAAIVFAVLVV